MQLELGSEAFTSTYKHSSTVHAILWICSFVILVVIVIEKALIRYVISNSLRVRIGATTAMAVTRKGSTKKREISLPCRPSLSGSWNGPFAL